MKNTFCTIATFTYTSEAQIIKGKLASEGIEVYLANEHTINTDPMASIAVGGVKLQVLNTQKEKALEILKDVSPYSVDDSGKLMTCPNCKKDTVGYYSTVKDIKSLFFFLLGMITNILPFHTKYTYRCESCNTEFN